jgi:hypothetical protein
MRASAERTSAGRGGAGICGEEDSGAALASVCGAEVEGAFEVACVVEVVSVVVVGGEVWEVSASSLAEQAVRRIERREMITPNRRSFRRRRAVSVFFD